MRNYLKKLRLTFKLTQEQVAEKLLCTRQYYNLIENGYRQNNMDVNTAMKLADIFKVPITFILEEEQKL